MTNRILKSPSRVEAVISFQCLNRQVFKKQFTHGEKAHYLTHVFILWTAIQHINGINGWSSVNISSWPKAFGWPVKVQSTTISYLYRRQLEYKVSQHQHIIQPKQEETGKEFSAQQDIKGAFSQNTIITHLEVFFFHIKKRVWCMNIFADE